MGHLCSLRKQTQVKREGQRAGEAGQLHHCGPPKTEGLSVFPRRPRWALTVLCSRHLQNGASGRSEDNAPPPPTTVHMFHTPLTASGQQPGGCGLGTSPPPASPPPAYLQTQVERGHLTLALLPGSIVPTTTPHAPSTTLQNLRALPNTLHLLAPGGGQGFWKPGPGWTRPESPRRRPLLCAVAGRTGPRERQGPPRTVPQHAACLRAEVCSSPF